MTAALAPFEAKSAGAGEGNELQLASRPVGGGVFRTELSVPDIHCAGCMRRVEGTLSALPGVTSARVNLSTRRATVSWSGATPPPITAALAAVGYPAHILDAGADKDDKQLRGLVLATAVAGFAAANIMLLSVSVWSGADPATRELFHWISALIALPALAYSGRPFFLSAWNALRHRTTNMDVPISVGVALAFGLSIYETMTGGEHAFFDASITLLFFLLIGRTLDHMMREKARTAIVGLVKLAPRGANVVTGAGITFVPLEEVEVGSTVVVPAGERIPLDGTVAMGTSDIDCAIVTGESAYEAVEPGSTVLAGTLNVSAPLRVRVTARTEGSFLAEMVRLMEAAEGSRARYRRLADRVAQYYSPVVHLAALATTVGWILVTGDWHRAISVGIAVLIITCPCALGLAVPMVQVMSARRLFECGILIKDGSAIERLIDVDTVVFDKTGTLTTGFAVSNIAGISRDALNVAAAIAAHSSHPIARSIVQGAGAVTPVEPTSVREVPGAGLEAEFADGTYRLGRADWALDDGTADATGTVLARNGTEVARFAFADRLRKGARETIERLLETGLKVEVLSGDAFPAVSEVAADLGVADWRARARPADKVERLNALRAEGRKVLMVGDGLNDGPALAAADVSMAPGSAAELGRNAADFVFLHESLEAVVDAFEIAHKADRLTKQNLTLAIVYNLLAVPIAILGFVTPLVAALAMSVSSILVVVNALRLTKARASSSAAPAAGKLRTTHP